MASAASEERAVLAWLGEVEARAVLPLKAILLAFTLALWIWQRGAAPAILPFSIFLFFLLSLLAEAYFILFDRVTPRQIKPLIYTSFVLDGLFLIGIVLADTNDPIPGRGSDASPYALFFLLLVLRGFAIFRSRRANVIGFLYTLVLFAVAVSASLAVAGPLEASTLLQQLALLWGAVLLTQAFVGILNDRLEEALRAQEARVRGESLASISELAAGVAHEINNPIGIIKTYADYLQRAAPPDSPYHEDFQTIHREAERCELMIRQMLTLSTPRLEGFQPVQVEALLLDATASVFPKTHEDRIALDTIIATRLPAVLGDAAQLRQAFVNLLANARQILLEHAAANAGFAPRVSVVVERAPGLRAPVRITIADNGPGVLPEDLPRLFEPFYTRRKGGTGLGLPITRRIVEAHRGTLRLESAPGRGLSAIIDLPMQGEEES